ncbi:ribonuclease H-like domain-containing protein, partial [Tanacetum coccineum]
MYSFNLENIVPLGGLACLIAKAATDESNKWHRRLGHVNFKNLNKLVKGNLVRGLPSKIFQNDHTCVACQKESNTRPPVRPNHKVFSFMVKKGKHFSGTVTPLFATMLVQPTQDEGAHSERPSEAQPTPSPAPTSEVPNEPQTDSSPAQTSEVPIEQQTDLSPRPSPTTIIPDSILENSSGNLGGHMQSWECLLLEHSTGDTLNSDRSLNKYSIFAAGRIGHRS